MERLQREKKRFGLEFLYFFLLVFSRFFDHKLQGHPVPFAFMEHYGAAVGLAVIYLLLLLGLTGVVLRMGKKSAPGAGNKEAEEKTREREICWISIFLSVFAAPFFLHRDYFGAADELVWTFLLAVLLLLLLAANKKNREGIRHRTETEENDEEAAGFAAALLIAGVFTVTAVVLGFLVSDVQDLLSGRQFVVMLLLLSPYGYWGLRFLTGLMRRARGRKRWTYVLCAAGGICPAVLWTAAGDYSRAFFYGFTGIILPTLCLMALGDTLLAAHVRRAKEEIRKVLPIPAVFVLYPLIFITFWMMGWESIPAEEILKLQ